VAECSSLGSEVWGGGLQLRPPIPNSRTQATVLSHPKLWAAYKTICAWNTLTTCNYFLT